MNRYLHAAGSGVVRDSAGGFPSHLPHGNGGRQRAARRRRRGDPGTNGQHSGCGGGPPGKHLPRRYRSPPRSQNRSQGHHYHRGRNGLGGVQRRRRRRHLSAAQFPLRAGRGPGRQPLSGGPGQQPGCGASRPTASFKLTPVAARTPWGMAAWRWARNCSARATWRWMPPATSIYPNSRAIACGR